jgi:hypothetical protein
LKIIDKCNALEIYLPRLEQEKQILLQFDDALKENKALFGMKRVAEKLDNDCPLKSIIVMHDIDVFVCKLQNPSGIFKINCDPYPHLIL